MLSLAAILSLALGYILGAIPFGLVLTKLSGAGDVRSTGSGNIGATNVLRHAGKPLAAATLLCDLLKGTIAVVGGGWLVAGIGGGVSDVQLGGLLGGFGAFLGHLYPVWLKFKGGKGVATFIGVLLGVDWRFAVGFCLCWLLTAFLGRISSLSALVASALVSAVAWYAAPPATALAVSVMSLLVYWRHHENITRILAGKEPKIGASKASTGRKS